MQHLSVCSLVTLALIIDAVGRKLLQLQVELDGREGERIWETREAPEKEDDGNVAWGRFVWTNTFSWG